MQRRQGVPGSLNQQRQAGTHPAQGSQDNVGNAQKYTRKSSHTTGGTGDAALCLYDRWRGLPGETIGERLPRGR